MSSERHATTRQIVRAIARATADILTISTMIPVAFTSYLSYKIALFLILISFNSITVDRASEIAAGIRQLAAEVKAERLPAVKSGLARVLPWNMWPSLRWSSIRAGAQAMYDGIIQQLLFAYIHLRLEYLPNLSV